MLFSNSKKLEEEYEQKLQTFQNMAASTLRRISEFAKFGLSHSKKRDLKKVFGWPEDFELTYEFFQDWYERSGFANVLIAKPPRSCWRDGATIRQDDDEGPELLGKELLAIKKAGFFSRIEKADIENRKGHFSVLYVGLPGDGEPKEPIESMGNRGNLEDVYFSVFAENAVTVSQYDTDPTSPNYGEPLIYTLTPGTSNTTTGSNLTDTRQPITVHRDRIIHLAEGATVNDFVGVPYLKPIIDRLIDLNKTCGGAGEGFFRKAKPQKTVDVEKEASIKPTEWAALQEQAEEWINGWQEFIGISGGKVRTLTDPVDSPMDTAMVNILEIAAYTGWTKRQLTGEGGGQYAGNEDKASYNQIISDRQNQFCSPAVMRLLTILSKAGYFDLPDNAVISWPIPKVQDEKSKSEANRNNATAAASLATALATYAQTPSMEDLIPLEEFLIEFLDIPESRAKEIAAKAKTRRDAAGEVEAMGEGEQ